MEPCTLTVCTCVGDVQCTCVLCLQLGARKGKGLGAQKLNKSFSEIEQQIEQQQKEQGELAA